MWVAGLGPNALSAVGIFFPLFFIFLAISLGLNVGSNSAISRRIGAKDVRGANLTAIHAFLVGFLVSIPMTASVILLTPAMILLGAGGEVLQLSIEYGRIMILGSVFLMFNNTSMGILNGEGNAKRAMYANTIGSVLNIILDPIFIYVLNLGVAGAAHASVLSMVISSAVFLFWFLTGKTFVKPEFPFKWD
ncbi:MULTISPECIES: MATE family efflux transporter [unclassified Archaeoglobus]|uniref:MATE family efflux transporter n=1 Tax=unclassified Archaeoglobus TaxID=2643606 RepID=UPI0025B7D3DF|nr:MULTISPECIES: MATE family efflux transporter [unclassified Archaeoglobus]